jgi:aspartate/methionine/tyrosine aminotransferase
MVVPERLYMPVRKIQDTVLICPPVISQWAAVGAMQAGRAYCRERLRVTTEIRRIVLDRLREIDDLVTVPQADGAFYLLVRVRTAMDPMQLVQRLIEEYKVAVIPGSTFGVGDRCLLRVAYGALEEDTATEGIDRLVRGLKQFVRA